MKQVARAVWFIESHLGEELTLSSVAQASHVAEETLCRYFILATGKSVFGYIRSRRLHVSIARILDVSEPLVQIAISSGYSSQEAFNRAFRREFGFTPGMLRSAPELAEPLEMNAMRIEPETNGAFHPPRLEKLAATTIRGLEITCGNGGDPAIPGLWGRLNSVVEPDGKREAAYGVCHSFNENGMRYLVGFPVDDDLPDELSDEVVLSSGSYAVFSSNHHVSEIAAVWQHAFAQGLSESGYEATGGPCFERYGRSFDPASGQGGFEIWIPVEN